MSPSRPLLSVSIPTYDRCASVVAIVRDVEPQLLAGDELLIVDDASPDDTTRIVRDTFADLIRDGRLRVVRNDANLGMVTNWNQSLRLAANPWILTLHDDDQVQPFGLHALRQVIDALDQRPGIYVGGHMPPFPANPSDPADPANAPNATADDATDPAVRFQYSDPGPWAVLNAPPVPTGVTVHRSVYDAHGLYDERFRFSSDMELFPRLARHAPLIWIHHPAIVNYHLHADNHQLRTWQDPDFFPQIEQILHQIADYAGLQGAARHTFFQRQMTRHLRYMLRRCEETTNPPLASDLIQRLLKLPNSVRRRGRLIAAVTSLAGWYPPIIAR